MIPCRIAAALAAVLATALAQTVPSSSHCETGPNGQLCYAINVPSDSTDSLYISVTGPSATGYAGLGFGRVMANSLFFISMPTSNNNVTVSVRSTGSEVMPTAYSSTPVTVQILSGTKNSGGTFLVNFKCTGCRKWSTGTLDVTSASANMIWSTGSLSSSSVPTDPNAMILYHGTNNGNFNINLQSATGAAGIPGSLASTGSTGSSVAASAGAATSTTSSAGTAASSSTNAASTNPFAGSTTSSTSTKRVDRRALWWSHAAFMTLGWILIIGVGAIVMRFVPGTGTSGKSVRLHYMLQLSGAAFVVIGAGLGIAGSQGSQLTYAHQYLGIVVFAVMFLQIALGTVHHIWYLKASEKGSTSSSPILALMHRYLGRSLIVAAMVNAGLAFRMPMVGLGKASQITWYVIMGVIVLAYTIANFTLKRSPGRSVDSKRQRTTGPLQNGREKETLGSTSTNSH